MKTLAGLLCILFSASAFSQSPATHNGLLDHLAGQWVLQGTIAGKETTHDVSADWVLRHQYLQMHEVSREKDSTGQAAYEAIVLFGWDQKRGEYGCLWLDITGGWSFTDQGIGRGRPQGNEIPFLFTFPDSVYFHTTFVYDGKNDSWKCLMDDDEKGIRKAFARLTLTRNR